MKRRIKIEQYANGEKKYKVQAMLLWPSWSTYYGDFDTYEKALEFLIGEQKKDVVSSTVIKIFD